MDADKKTLPDDPAKLKEIIAEMATEQRRYIKEIDLLHERVRLLYAKLFGKKSEKYSDGENPQLPLFDMPEPEEIEPEQEKVEIDGYSRKKTASCRFTPSRCRP